MAQNDAQHIVHQFIEYSLTEDTQKTRLHTLLYYLTWNDLISKAQDASPTIPSRLSPAP